MKINSIFNNYISYENQTYNISVLELSNEILFLFFFLNIKSENVKINVFSKIFKLFLGKSENSIRKKKQNTILNMKFKFFFYKYNILIVNIIIINF